MSLGWEERFDNATLAAQVTFAPDAKVVGWVFEEDALWFRRPKGYSWHLLRPAGPVRSYCGLQLQPKDLSRVAHVTWPWMDRGCWTCMVRRWSKGLR